MHDRLLVIDTATPACSVALFEEGELLAAEYEEIGRGHAERLIPLIADLPEKGRANKILVNCGPGSFTGVRIGISAAKALALAWKSKLQGYQTLHLVAAQALYILDNKAPIYIAMSGGHGEMFVQNFGADASPIDNMESLYPKLAAEKCSAEYTAGSGAADLGLDLTTQQQVHYPNAKHANLLPQESHLTQVSPIYGREPDAKPNNVSAQ